MDNANLQHGDCLKLLPAIASCSVDFVATDPPYFIDGMGNDWELKDLTKLAKKAKVVGKLPVGMKFDPQQSRKLYSFLSDVFGECYRVLKPGGFLVSFSQARLYHAVAQAAEDECFEIRDLMGWVYDQSQSKAQSLARYIKEDVPPDEKAKLIKEMAVYKTPQLRPMIEPIVLAQKPKEGNFVDNWRKYGVGLMNTDAKIDGKFAGNIIRISKPEGKEKEDNDHFTVKPVMLMKHLIELFCPKNGLVLDPFLGSGTTAVAALSTGRCVIGMEMEEKYYKLASWRVSNELQW